MCHCFQDLLAHFMQPYMFYLRFPDYAQTDLNTFYNVSFRLVIEKESIIEFFSKICVLWPTGQVMAVYFSLLMNI